MMRDASLRLMNAPPASRPTALRPSTRSKAEGLNLAFPGAELRMSATKAET